VDSSPDNDGTSPVPPDGSGPASKKRTFSYLHSFAWRRVTRWLRKRHVGLNWTAIRRRFRHGWQIAADGIELFMPSAVAVTRYCYRGTKIPTPWTPTA
jgi:RNA-directed DNA polymerase